MYQIVFYTIHTHFNSNSNYEVICSYYSYLTKEEMRAKGVLRNSEGIYFIKMLKRLNQVLWVV